MPLGSDLRALFVRPKARDATAPLDGLRALAFVWIFQVHLWASLFIGSPVPRLAEYYAAEPLYADLVMRGHLAVDVFNVLSAFLAFSALLGTRAGRLEPGAPAARPKVPLSTWLASRLMRVVPFYYCFLGACLAIHKLAEPLPGASNAWANFAFVSNMVPFQDIFMPHTWTMSLEVQFAAVLVPLLAFVMASLDSPNTRPFRALAAIGMVALTLRLFGVAVVALLTPGGLALPLRIHTMDWFVERLPQSATFFYQWVYLPPWSRVVSFLVGAAAAYAVARPPASAAPPASSGAPAATPVRGPKGGLPLPRPAPAGGVAHARAKPRRVAACLVLMAAAAWPRLTSHAEEPRYGEAFAVLFASFHRAAFALPLGVLLYWCVHAQERRRPAVRALASFLSWRCWYPIAQLSYVAYLLHVLVIGGVLRGMASDEPVTAAFLGTRFAVAFAGTLVVSVLASVLVERPLNRLRLRLVPPATVNVAAAAAAAASGGKRAKSS